MVQLGYAVWFSEWRTLSACAVAFLLQSGEHSAEHLERRVAAFAESMAAKLAALEPADFASQVCSGACQPLCVTLHRASGVWTGAAKAALHTCFSSILLRFQRHKVCTRIACAMCISTVMGCLRAHAVRATACNRWRSWPRRGWSVQSGCGSRPRASGVKSTTVRSNFPLLQLLHHSWSLLRIFGMHALHASSAEIITVH